MDRPDIDLLRGAIDLHAHTHPALFRRPIDDIDLTRMALDAGMRGFVLKDHDSSTTGRAYHLQKNFADAPIEPFGGIVLNRTVGGINPYVVQGAIHYGAKIVWMPSNHSKWHREYFKISDYPQLGRPKKQLVGDGVTILDENGQVTKETHTLLDIVAENDVALATGHLSLNETRLLLDEARKRDIKKIIYTHANWALTKITPDIQKELISKGATMEYVAVSCASPLFNEQDPTELAQWIMELGPDNAFISSDLGQPSAAPHPEGMRMLLCALLDVGVPYEWLEKMVKVNPAKLLNLEPA